MLFDALPAERQRYMTRYGCAAWTEEALDACKENAPLVEIGAGAGHWYKALCDRNVDVVAFDDASEIPHAVRDLPAVGVKQGSEKVLTEPTNASRSLLLVYPPPDGMALRCIQSYSGNTVLYVGEARGGYNADEKFFDTLESRWRVKRIIELKPFPGGHERLYVLRRRHAWAYRIIGG